MPLNQTRFSAIDFDLSVRFVQTTTVAASPAANAETTIATLTIPNFAGITVTSGIWLSGWAAYTVGTAGTAVTLQIRQTSGAGTSVGSTGALTKTAGNLYADDVQAFDATPGVGVYLLRMTVTGGAAASTVSQLVLTATIV